MARLLQPHPTGIRDCAVGETLCAIGRAVKKAAERGCPIIWSEIKYLAAHALKEVLGHFRAVDRPLLNAESNRLRFLSHRQSHSFGSLFLPLRCQTCTDRRLYPRGGLTETKVGVRRIGIWHLPVARLLSLAPSSTGLTLPK